MKTVIKNKIMLILAVFIITTVSVPIALSQQNNVALLLQQKPTDAGIVSPGIGVHSIQKNGVVRLNAIPQPGYQFAYWLGDVKDPKSASTTALLEGPKIIIAVFEKSEFIFENYQAGPTSAPAGRLIPSPQDLVAHSNNPVAQKRGHSYSYSYSTEEEEEENENEIPVPGDEEQNGNGDPIPEPATIILLSLAAAMVPRKRK